MHHSLTPTDLGGDIENLEASTSPGNKTLAAFPCCPLVPTLPPLYQGIALTMSQELFFLTRNKDPWDSEPFGLIHLGLDLLSYSKDLTSMSISLANL